MEPRTALIWDVDISKGSQAESDNICTKVNPGMLDVVEWVLFDQRTYSAYESAVEQIQAEKIVNTPTV